MILLRVQDFKKKLQKFLSLKICKIMIEIKNVKKSYFLEDTEIPIIQNVNLHINE